MVLGKCFVNDLLNIYLCCFQVPVLENRGSVSEWVAENFSSTTLNLVPVVEAAAADFTKVKFTLSSNLELDD